MLTAAKGDARDIKTRVRKFQAGGMGIGGGADYPINGSWSIGHSFILSGYSAPQ